MLPVIKKKLTRERRKNRNRAKIFGTGEKPRFSVFRSNKYFYIQLIDDASGKTLAAVSAKQLSGDVKKTKTEKARSLGELIAEKAVKLGIKKAVFNKSFYKYHGQVKAAAEGARAKGLEL